MLATLQPPKLTLLCGQTEREDDLRLDPQVLVQGALEKGLGDHAPDFPGTLNPPGHRSDDYSAL